MPAVIDINTYDDGEPSVHSVPPFPKSDPMWKQTRIIEDVHIVKMNSSGFCAPQASTYKTDAGIAFARKQIGGIGIHMLAANVTSGDYRSHDIWTSKVSGVRIAGAFNYGINIENAENYSQDENGNYTHPSGTPTNPKDPAWNHDLRLEASIVSAETAVRLYNCNTAHLKLDIQPSNAIGVWGTDPTDGKYKELERGMAYAKNGIILEYCRNIDITESVIWDWYNEGGTLYDPTDEVGKTYTHIALIGDCAGLTLSDMYYTEKSSKFADVRELIYTNYPQNWEKAAITQEPVTRWFAPKTKIIPNEDGVATIEAKAPYFVADENDPQKLITEEELSHLIQYEYYANFTNYKDNVIVGARVSSDGTLNTNVGDGGYYLTIDFFEFSKDDTLYLRNFYIPTKNLSEAQNTKIVFYNANKQHLSQMNFRQKIENNANFYLDMDYEDLGDGSWKINSISVPDSKKSALKNAAFIRICTPRSINPNYDKMIIAKSPIGYAANGKIAEGITISQSQISDLNIEDTGATSVEITGPGNAVTAAAYDADTRKITLTKGSTFNNYEHPKGNAPSKTSGLYKFSTDASSHVSDVTAVTKSDITALGIPGSDTTYSAGTGLALSGTTINHTNTITAKNSKNQETAAPGYGGTFKVTEPLYDATGHITGINTATITMPAAQTIPSALKNPHPLSINDTVYDGSKAVEVDTREFVVTITATDVDTEDDALPITADKTYDEVYAAYVSGRPIVCNYFGPMFDGYRFPLSMYADGVGFIFINSPMMGVLVLIQYGDNTDSQYAVEQGASITIGTQHFHFDEEADFTDTINAMIDAKAYSHPSTHPANMITGLATVATSGKYSDLSGTPTIPVIPNSLKNPNALIINGTIYDGSEEKNISGLATETYVTNQIAAIPTPDVSGQINNHNTAEDSHNDIRLLVDGLTTRLNTLANSDDTTLDQMSEVVAYIKNNKSLIDGITTNKVNVADIVNNLTTNITNKPLSAAQGVALKALIDELVDDKANSDHTHSNYASTVTTTGSGNAITSISQSGNTITATKGATFLTAHPTISKSTDTTSTANPAHDNTFTAIDSITRDSNGHVTKVNTKTISLPEAGLHYVANNNFTVTEGSSTSGAYLATKWTTSSVDGITTPTDGMSIAIRTPAAGCSGGILLSIDGGSNYYPIVRNVNTLVTTYYPAGSTIMVTFNSTQTASPYVTSNTKTEVTGCWQIADYDANTKTSSGTSNKAGTKMYLVGATSQNSSGVTTYSNKNCYIGTDNCLYSEGKKTVTVDDSLKNPNSFIINDVAYDGSKEIKFNAMPLGGTLLDQTFVVSALSDAKTHRTLMSLGEQNAFLFQVTNLETEAQQFFTMNDQGSYLTNLRVDEPVNDNNAATKKYVDEKIGQIEFGLY